MFALRPRFHLLKKKETRENKNLRLNYLVNFLCSPYYNINFFTLSSNLGGPKYRLDLN
jgi:hypothetical protein